MNLYRSLRAVATASGDGPIDWAAVGEAARAATEPGSLDLAPGEREGYADDVREARREVRRVAATDFDLPRAVEVQNRHHWIDANVSTFARVLSPLEDQTVALPGVARRLNTATMAGMVSFLGSHVLGQYDPILLADGDHGLYFVRPNIRRVADAIDADYPRFRRWIAFHEVAHAAEFGAAPWLTGHLEARMTRAVEALAEGGIDRDAVSDLDAAMTAVEGYAEFVLDRAFEDSAGIRAKIEARRRSRDPLVRLVGRLLGLGLKRRQYERGKAFFEAVADARGPGAAARVWDAPANLPTDAELDRPERWLARL